jgi:hypothetical protein
MKEMFMVSCLQYIRKGGTKMLFGEQAGRQSNRMVCDRFMFPGKGNE